MSMHRRDLAALEADAPGYLVAGLREKELTYFNSRVLHEASAALG